MKNFSISYKKDVLRFLKFCIVGISNTCVHYILFIFLLHTLGIHYIVASICGYFAGTVNSYFWNSKWTFTEHQKRSAIEIICFLGVNLVSLATNSGTLYLSVEYTGFTPEIGQLIGIATGLFVNFTGCSLFVFQSCKKGSMNKCSVYR